jgi:hypothetical protein
MEVEDERHVAQSEALKPLKSPYAKPEQSKPKSKSPKKVVPTKRIQLLALALDATQKKLVLQDSS